MQLRREILQHRIKKAKTEMKILFFLLQKYITTQHPNKIYLMVAQQAEYQILDLVQHGLKHCVF
jgi:Fic family protein